MFFLTEDYINRNNININLE